MYFFFWMMARTFVTYEAIVVTSFRRALRTMNTGTIGSAKAEDRSAEESKIPTVETLSTPLYSPA